MLLTEGINRIRDLFNTNTDKGQFGTGTTSELITDTGLGTAIAATLKSATSTTADNWVEKTTEVNSTEGNGNTLAEYGLQKSSSSTFVNRVTFNGLAKTNLFNLKAKTRYYFK